MGRVGEVDHAHLADRAQDEGAARRAAARTARATTIFARAATSPSTRSTRRSRTASRTRSGSIEVGKLADLVLWQPAFFGVKPALIIKGGMIVAAPMGDPNASIPTPQPVHYRRMFGALGGARAATSVTFVRRRRSMATSARRLRAAQAAGRGDGHAQHLGKRDMILNDYLPHIEVDPQTYEVRADGELLTCEPATRAAAGAALLPVLTTPPAMLHSSIDRSHNACSRRALPMRGWCCRSSCAAAAAFARGWRTARRSACMLARGQILRGGDLLLADDGRVVEVAAAPESVRPCARAMPRAAGARRLSPRQSPRGAADRGRLAALQPRSRAR